MTCTKHALPGQPIGGLCLTCYTPEPPKASTHSLDDLRRLWLKSDRQERQYTMAKAANMIINDYLCTGVSDDIDRLTVCLIGEAWWRIDEFEWTEVTDEEVFWTAKAKLEEVFRLRPDTLKVVVLWEHDCPGCCMRRPLNMMYVEVLPDGPDEDTNVGDHRPSSTVHPQDQHMHVAKCKQCGKTEDIDQMANGVCPNCMNKPKPVGPEELCMKENSCDYCDFDPFQGKCHTLS